MKRLSILFIVLFFAVFGFSTVHAQKISIDEAILQIRKWNETSRPIPLGEEGWVHLVYREIHPEDTKGLRFPLDGRIEKWYWINREGIKEEEAQYVLTETGERKLVGVHLETFGYSYMDSYLISDRILGPYQADFSYADELEAMIAEQECRQFDAQITEGEVDGRKGVLLEMLCYLRMDFKLGWDTTSEKPYIGPYDRYWYDHETGSFLKSERYRMFEDRTASYISTVEVIQEERIDVLPDEVRADFERTRNKAFETVNPDSVYVPIPVVPEIPVFYEKTITPYTGPSGTIGNVQYSTGIEMRYYPRSIWSEMNSHTSENINMLGGNYIGVREYCNHIFQNNHQFGGWADWGKKDSIKTVLVPAWTGSCEWSERSAGAAALFVFQLTTTSMPYTFEFKTHPTP